MHLCTKFSPLSKPIENVFSATSDAGVMLFTYSTLALEELKTYIFIIEF